MNIQNISLSDIHPYARNPRKNDEAVKNVAASIREFGFLVPLVIDRNHEIVAGHTRYKAAKSLGMKEVPCVIADELTEDQIKAFRLADNKVSEAAQWDMDLLPLELADIVMPMTDFGFETHLRRGFLRKFHAGRRRKEAISADFHHRPRRTGQAHSGGDQVRLRPEGRDGDLYQRKSQRQRAV